MMRDIPPSQTIDDESAVLKSAIQAMSAKLNNRATCGDEYWSTDHRITCWELNNDLINVLIKLKKLS